MKVEGQKSKVKGQESNKRPSTFDLRRSTCVGNAIRFSNVSKRFRLGRSHDSMRDLIASGLSRLVGRGSSEPDRRAFWAVRDVDFAVSQGEAVGIIGPNGAGKSTVLKLLAGILRPDHGDIATQGRLAALIEVGAGFHGDLSGRENIFLNGAIMGMSRAEIRRKLDAIVAFAGLERFLDMPVKRYSSGMYARLGFSIASHVDPNILLVDEVLSVGDAVFRLRCMERMRQLVRHGTTLVFVTHNLEQMQSICARAIVLESGRVTFAGSSREAVGHYLQAVSRSYISRPTDLAPDQRETNAAVKLMNLKFFNDGDEEVVWSRSGESVRCEVTFRLHRPVQRLVIELNMRANVEENLLSINSGRDGRMFEGCRGCHAVTLTIPNIPVCGGQYFWNVRMWDADQGSTELDTPFRFPLVVDDGGRATGILALNHKWSFDRLQRDQSAAPPSRRLQPARDAESQGRTSFEESSVVPSVPSVSRGLKPTARQERSGSRLNSESADCADFTDSAQSAKSADRTA